jgi:altronate hydrolase
LTPRLLRLELADNVAVALTDLAPGEAVRAAGVLVQSRGTVPAGHKIALRYIGAGEAVIKHGFSIGRATTRVAAGEHIHTHNLRSDLRDKEEYSYEQKPTALAPVPDDRTFDAFVRPGGEIGVRNEVWVVPTVGCVNTLARKLAARAARWCRGTTVDGVHAFPHPFGCSQLGDDLRNTQRVLAGLVRHPNAAAVLVVGLGCENNSIDAFRPAIGETDPERVAFLNAQDEEDEPAAGLELLRRLIDRAAAFRPSAVPVSRLRVGLKCGASDGFSGLTANPLVGAFSDWLVSRGGTAILTEVPEMFGAERLLMRRCATREVFERCVRMIDGFKRHYLSHGQPIDRNPSPGNIAGGITTLEEKSLGCVQKGGSGQVSDVIDYGGRATQPGLNLLAAPGNDIVSQTALAAAGAHLVLFTTGRGTPLGGPVPTIKVASTTDLARRKRRWIDFDAGPFLRERKREEMTLRFVNYVLSVASGERRARNERNDAREIAIWKTGVTL